MPPRLIQIGVIAAAHGIRGQVKIRSFAEYPEDIFTYKDITDADGSRTFKLTHRGGMQKGFIADVEGVASRNEAELLKGTALYIPTSALPDKKKNQWYYGELTGLTARLADGKRYGTIIGVHNFGAGDIIEIEMADGETEMLPFASPFIGEVKLQEGYLIVFPPDYVEAEKDE